MQVNIWKNIYLSYGERYENMIICNTGAVLYQLSYQANWELVILWVRNVLIDGEDASDYIKDNIFARNIWRHDWSSHLLYTT